MPPEGPNGPDVSPDQAKALLTGVGLHYHGHPKHPFMHRTETIDYGIVLSGEIWLVLDDEEVHLRPGDIVVQRGTIHAWSNRGTEVCRMAFVLIDGKFSDEVPKA
jgi:quercetin dioxygenase-like cupin family protein